MAKIGTIQDVDGNHEFILQINEDELRYIHDAVANSKAWAETTEKIISGVMLHALLDSFVKYMDET